MRGGCHFHTRSSSIIALLVCNAPMRFNEHRMTNVAIDQQSLVTRRLNVHYGKNLPLVLGLARGQWTN
jgi:hypothetical protein